MYSYILFDLDGTISDPKAGITGCVQYALKSFGIEEPDADKLEPFIGPPLRESFMKYYDFTPEQAERAVEKYRERFSVTGKYENALYPGMKELLRDLQAAGAHLAIASSKPTVFVEDILRYFGIWQYFEIVVGSELDGTRDKKEDVVAEVLSQLDKKGAADPSSVVMVGDRKFDIEGAKAAGTHHIGVEYGYAAPGELKEAGAEIVVKDVEGLRHALFGEQPVSRSEEQPILRTEGQPEEQPLLKVEEQPAARPEEQTVIRPEEQPVPQNEEQPAGQTGVQPPRRDEGQPASQSKEEPVSQPGLKLPPFVGSTRPQQENTPPERREQWQAQYTGPQYGSGQPQGVYSGYGDRYRRPRQESRGGRIAKAAGISLLAMAAYYLIMTVMVVICVYIGIFFYGAGNSEKAYNFWLNLGNSMGILVGFIACFGIWHKGIKVRPTRKINGLSLIPMAVLAAAVAMGLNGALSILELYKLSPKFQEISELQVDVPVWLGVISYGILAPLGEETVFRGVVYGQFRKALNAPIAIVLSGLVFGIFHGNLVQGVYATIIGILLAWVYELYGTILAPMAFHGIANLFVYVLLDLTQIGGVYVMPLSCLFFLLISAVSFVLMLRWQKQK